jgi:hypothetical protein
MDSHRSPLERIVRGRRPWWWKLNPWRALENRERAYAEALDIIIELGQQLNDVEDSARFYRRRCELLQEWQVRMRDPERQLVCDILANAQPLPDPHGKRYPPPNDALSGRGPIQHQETRWPLPAVRLNA